MTPPSTTQEEAARRVTATSFLQRCTDAGVRWALLRGADTLGRVGSDVDLLVHRADLPLFGELVREARGLVSPGRAHHGHRSYRLGGGWEDAVVLDVVTELDFGLPHPVPEDLAELFLDRRRHEEGLSLLDPTDHFWAVLLHCLLEKERVTARRADELSAVVGTVTRPSPGELFLAALLPAACSTDDAVAAVRAGNWRQLEACGDQLRADRAPARPGMVKGWLAPRAARAHALAWRKSSMGEPVRALRAEVDGVPSRVREIRRRPGWATIVLTVDGPQVPALEAALAACGHAMMWGRWWHVGRSGLQVVTVRPRDSVSERGQHRNRRRPLLVAFAGLDGAGKTTQIERLVQTLGAEVDVAVTWNPMRFVGENKLPRVLRSRLGPTRPSTHPSPSGTKAVVPERASAQRLLWHVIGSAAALAAAGNLRRRALGPPASVVVLDRYRLDTIIKLQFWYPQAHPGWLAAVVLALAPEPDAEFLLHLPGSAAHARKPEEWSVEQLTRQAALYERAALRAGARVIDAQQPVDVIADMVEAAVREQLFGSR